jgi:thiol:disulfide interchange protein
VKTEQVGGPLSLQTGLQGEHYASGPRRVVEDPRRLGRLPYLLLLLLAVCFVASAQNQVAWSLRADPATAAPGGEALIHATARIEPGWHLYSASSPAGLPATFQVEPGTLVAVYQQPPKKAFDNNLNAESETYEGAAEFLLQVKLPADVKPGPLPLNVKARFQTCNDTQCVPARWSGTAPVTVDPAAATVISIGNGFAKANPPAKTAQSPAAQSQGWAAFLLVAFGFGLLSIFTPCVFPMIPITMSYFLNRESGGRRDSVFQAVVFCLGIIVLFSGLGLLVTAVLGPFGISQLGANPWVNGFIAALFIAFGLSLLGAFEITIPSPILTRLNKSSDRGGYAGALLMGLTFSLAAFSCVGPFVGTLLAASVNGGGARPLAGMVSFAAGLALPFFLLALFPAYLKRLPRSGGWMARVKVVMAFVILAASLKYLSSLDQAMQWGFLTRERFLAAWIVLFAIAGLYLLGFVRLEGIKPDEKMGIARLLIGIAFLVFAISLLPGMFGGRLGELDAYVPEASGSAIGSGGPASPAALDWMKDDYSGALARARSEGKPVFLSFTGYACTNCHWMKANMFTRPEIAAALRNFVPLELYTDGTDAASEANGKLELAMFQTSAVPFYAIVDPDGKAIAKFPGATRDAKAYLAFLNSAAVTGASGQVSSAGESGLSDLPRVALDGSAISLEGKVAVVDFWATWCVPCVQEIPGFNKLNREYGPKGVAVLGISMDDDGRESVEPFLNKHPMQYSVALGSPDLNKKFNLESLPVTIVFDRSGKVVKRFDGFTPEADLLAAVRQAM